MNRDYHVTFSSAFDVHDFPFDRQELVVSGVFTGVTPRTINLLPFKGEYADYQSTFESSQWRLDDFKYQVMMCF
jgi:hypothetical protein